MTLCQFEHVGDAWQCVNCGRTVRSRFGNIRAACRSASDYAATNAALFAGAAGEGPGTELKRLLSKVGISAEPGCQCQRHAQQMNLWGCDECERRTDEIVGWLREEATRRGLPFFDAAGRMLVKRAIRNARTSLANPLRPSLASQ